MIDFFIKHFYLLAVVFITVLSVRYVNTEISYFYDFYEWLSEITFYWAIFLGGYFYGLKILERRDENEGDEGKIT